MKRIVFAITLMLSALGCFAQFNVDRMLASAEIALHYEDYPLSMAYDNQIIALRPYLYKPWQLRGTAKFYLDDYTGCEEDATEALRLNPYIQGLYDLRAMSRVRQQKWDAAIDDYTQGLKINPSSREFWYNRAVCELCRQNHSVAIAYADTMIRRWSGFVAPYTLKAEVLLQAGDTIAAIDYLRKGTEMDPYDANVWYTMGNVYLSRKEWKEAGLCYTKVLHFRPKHVPSLVNMALCRIHLGDYYGAKDNYARALDFDPNNFLAHYNRGLLCASLGQPEEALVDFNYILSVDPGNVLAQHNRKLLLNKKTSGREQWPLKELLKMRLRDEDSRESFASLVMDNPQLTSYDYEFLTEYRKRNGQKNLGFDNKPMFLISHVPYNNGNQSYQAYDRDVERFIAQGDIVHDIYVACGHNNVSPAVMRETFSTIDSLTLRINNLRDGAEAERLFMQRAVAHSVVQNYPDAISDLNSVIMLNPNSTIAYWQRAVCQSLLNGFNLAQGLDVRSKSVAVMNDIEQALRLAPENAYLYYNRAIVYALNQDTGKAIEDYTRAVSYEPHMAEAFYNRGLLYYNLGDRSSAARDMTKAVELGLREAYAILQRIGMPK